MTRASIVVVACLLGIAALVAPVAADDRTPSSVVGYALLGFVPPAPDPTHDYDDPTAVLGRPTTKFRAGSGPGYPGGDFVLSMVVGACNRDLDGRTVVTSIQPGGYITVKFDKPIEHDPANWYGKDFIVFGNAFFLGQGYVTATTDMETLKINNTAAGTWEPSTVSVSQDGTTWHTLTSGPFCDDFAPTQAYTWDRNTHNWDLELDWTKPLDPSLAKSNFRGKYVADAIDLYNGSAGGAAFDISSLPLPTNAQGRKWISYIRVNGTGGELDAISRVSHVPDVTSIADAKLLPDGASVRLAESVVTAAKSELGDRLYVESHDRTCGIRVTGRTIDRGRRVIIGGVMATVNGERKVKAISVDDLGDGTVAPLGVSGAGVSGSERSGDPETRVGLSTTGLLVRTWGRVGSIDTTKMTFTVDDGSGAMVKCIAPPDPNFELPADKAFVTVTGISALELNEQSRLVSVLRIRTQADLQ